MSELRDAAIKTLRDMLSNAYECDARDRLHALRIAFEEDRRGGAEVTLARGDLALLVKRIGSLPHTDVPMEVQAAVARALVALEGR